MEKKPWHLLDEIERRAAKMKDHVLGSLWIELDTPSIEEMGKEGERIMRLQLPPYMDIYFRKRMENDINIMEIRPKRSKIKVLSSLKPTPTTRKAILLHEMIHHFFHKQKLKFDNIFTEEANVELATLKVMDEMREELRIPILYNYLLFQFPPLEEHHFQILRKIKEGYLPEEAVKEVRGMKILSEDRVFEELEPLLLYHSYVFAPQFTYIHKDTPDISHLVDFLLRYEDAAREFKRLIPHIKRYTTLFAKRYGIKQKAKLLDEKLLDKYHEGLKKMVLKKFKQLIPLLRQKDVPVTPFISYLTFKLVDTLPKLHFIPYMKSKHYQDLVLSLISLALEERLKEERTKPSSHDKQH